jgi:hypothetical protein
MAVTLQSKHALAGIVEIAIPDAGGDYHTTNYPIPMFVSLRKYAVQGYQRRFFHKQPFP